MSPLLVGSTAIEPLPTRPTRARKIVDEIVADDGLRVRLDYVTDGASIPRAVWSIIGHPFEGLFVRPAADHDVRCEFRVGRWQDAHDRLLATLEAEGVERWRRDAMHAAVRRFGPRWQAADARTVADVLEIFARPLGPNGRPWGDYPGRRT